MIPFRYQVALVVYLLSYFLTRAALKNMVRKGLSFAPYNDNWVCEMGALIPILNTVFILWYIYMEIVFFIKLQIAIALLRYKNRKLNKVLDKKLKESRIKIRTTLLSVGFTEEQVDKMIDEMKQQSKI